ncbi:hypothetical protein MXB_82 [Myxobolus squamalis]|nr:hypothetical protein MXB_82 [Myxobolus squamalis]
MNESVNVESRFSPLPVFTPNHHYLFIKRIDFNNKIAFVELEIEGRLSRLLNNYVKFTSVFPFITQVQFCIKEEDWVESQFENSTDYYEDLGSLPDDESCLIDRKLLIQNILNHEDSMGGTNLYVYIPPPILSRLLPTSVVKVVW